MGSKEKTVTVGKPTESKPSSKKIESNDIALSIIKKSAHDYRLVKIT